MKEIAGGFVDVARQMRSRLSMTKSRAVFTDILHFCGRVLAEVAFRRILRAKIKRIIEVNSQKTSVEYDHTLSHTLDMPSERVTITLSANLLEEVDQLERNRSRFIAEAVQHEVARRRRAALLESIRTPHPDTALRVDVGLGDWTSDLPNDEGLLDPRSGTPIRWVEGQGWVKESA